MVLFDFPVFSEWNERSAFLALNRSIHLDFTSDYVKNTAIDRKGDSNMQVPAAEGKLNFGKELDMRLTGDIRSPRNGKTAAKCVRGRRFFH